MTATTDSTLAYASSEQASGSPIDRTEPLSPSSFPHSPRAGSNHLPTTIENVAHMLEQSRYSARFNVIKKQLELKRGAQPASMNEIISLANRHGLNVGLISSFCDEIGTRNQYNPVKEWILSKPWDGTDRLQAICDTVTSTDEYPEVLKNVLMLRWLTSATAAALVEDFHARGVLTFQGEQGLGKTSWIASLLPAGDLRNDWIKLDHHLDGSNKDSVITAITHWIVEIGELDSSFKKDVARLKGFLTDRCDKLRRPYARAVSENPRRTVFAATVNEERFLIDSTGNSRWWTIAVKALDYQHSIDMQQLYAQLAERLKAGDQWWLNPKEEKLLADYNLRHRSVSAIAERIQDAFDFDRPGQSSGDYRTAIEVLAAIGINHPSNPQCRECGAALRELVGPPKRINGRDKWRVKLQLQTLSPIRKALDDEDEY